MLATAMMSVLISATAVKSNHLEVNGVNYYYEVRGSGEPLLLLHGGLGSIEMFDPILPIFEKQRQVIAVDLQGHGRTTLGSRPFTLEAMGADMAAIIKKVGVKQVDVVGYSLGAAVALQFAAQNPQLVRRLVLVSCGVSDQDFYPEIRAMQNQLSGAMADMMKGTPMYRTYVKLAPNPKDFPKLLDAIGAFMKKSYDYSGDVAKLTMPVELIYGDSDMFRPEAMVKFYQLLGGGLKDAGWQRENMAKNRLAILPGVTHYDMMLQPEMATTALKFLRGEQGKADWK